MARKNLDHGHKECIIQLARSTGWKSPRISASLRIPARTVRHVLLNHQLYGMVANQPRFGVGRPQKLTGMDLSYLESLLKYRPDYYLRELAVELFRVKRVTATESIIHRGLHNRLLSRKQLSKIACERKEEERLTWRLCWGDLYRPDQLVFADECHCNRQSAQRRWGWARVGRRARFRSYFVHGQKYSMLPAMSHNGMLLLHIYDRPVNGNDFIGFVQDLLPVMNPFPGPNSVLVIDNASIHHVPEVRHTIEIAGMHLEYLPAYSPDLNPIEEAFSSVKAWIRRRSTEAVARLGPLGRQPFEFLRDAIYSVTPAKACRWFIDSGYV